MDSEDITFITGDAGLLDDVRELWEELNQVHVEKSVDFKDRYRALTFAARKEFLAHHGKNGKLLVVIACCNSLKIGYCIASVAEGTGEVDSLFVKSDYRKGDIGHRLMEQSLNWMKSHAAKEITVKVSAGNEGVFGFYSNYGFVPKLTELQIV